MIFPKENIMPSKTLFSEGAVLELSKEVMPFGSKGLIVHGRSLEKNGYLERIIKSFSPEASVRTYMAACGEPVLCHIADVIESARSYKADWIAGIGGGSVLDLAKAAAGLFNAKEDPVFYQEGGTLEEAGIPFIAVPTTAGTGSEATINSVIINEEKQVKLSIRDNSFLARTVILDPELLIGLPKDVLVYAGMDALVQAYESYISRNATWFSEMLALKAVNLINDNIVKAYKKSDISSLKEMLLGSYFAGVAFASSRLGVIHGLAHPLGVIYNLPHGLICSACFLPAIKINKDTIGEKYNIISEAIGKDLIARVEDLLNICKIGAPFEGKELANKIDVINAVLSSGSTAANPKTILVEDVEIMLSALFKKQ
jgi:alcohol dehydrogenase class IV